MDASKSIAPPYHYYPLQETALPPTLDTHRVSPEALMFLARTLFAATTPASVLAIRGYEFEAFSDSLSPEAEQNLVSAFHYLEQRYSYTGRHSLTGL